jgi:hypothetical protein
MSYAPPTPPEELPDDFVETLTQYSNEQLRDVARYAEALAEYRERKARLEENDESEEFDLNDDLPEEVPSKATITIKTINGNRYYYWQWREGEKIKSKYKGPVDSGET